MKHKGGQRVDYKAQRTRRSATFKQKYGLFRTNNIFLKPKDDRTYGEAGDLEAGGAKAIRKERSQDNWKQQFTTWGRYLQESEENANRGVERLTRS